MGLDFVAIDFETANFSRGSACAVGLIRVEAGNPVARDEWFIDPPGGAYFTNTFIHGITAEHVAGAPSWAETLDRLETFASGLPLVAYSGFDRGVYNAANSMLETADRGFTWLNAHSLARRRFPGALDDYRLPTVAKHLGVSGFRHHDAAEDASACAGIVLKIAVLDGATDLAVLWPARTDSRTGRVRTYTPRGPLPEANAEADPNHPLYGEVVCFSGTLDGFTKAEAQRIAADFGASVDLNVTKETTLVVMGVFHPSHLRDGFALSNKVEKAMTLAAKGQRIEVIDNDEFLRLINLDPADY